MTRRGSGRAAAGRARLATAMALALGAGCGAPGADGDEPVKVAEPLSAAAAPDRRDHTPNPNPGLFAVDSHPYGASMQEWADDWLRWEYSIPAATNPNIVAGVSYDQHQRGPVYFVPLGPNHDDAFSVPHHRALALMLSQIGNDYPCPDPNFKPAPGQSLFDFLSAGLTAINDGITVLEVSIDGVPVQDPGSYRFTSKRLFFFTGDPSLAANFDACVTGKPQPAVVDDLFLLLQPLARGRHVIKTHIENTDGGVFDRTRTITAE
jgi:hypothetical protein